MQQQLSKIPLWADATRSSLNRQQLWSNPRAANKSHLAGLSAFKVCLIIFIIAIKESFTFLFIITTKGSFTFLGVPAWLKYLFLVKGSLKKERSCCASLHSLAVILAASKAGSCNFKSSRANWSDLNGTWAYSTVSRLLPWMQKTCYTLKKVMSTYLKWLSLVLLVFVANDMQLNNCYLLCLSLSPFILSHF